MDGANVAVQGKLVVGTVGAEGAVVGAFSRVRGHVVL